MSNLDARENVLQDVERNEVADTLGLPHLSNMSDRAIAEETLHQLRSVGLALKEFQSMGPGGVMKMLMGR